GIGGHSLPVLRLDYHIFSLHETRNAHGKTFKRLSKPNRGSFAIRKNDTACYRFIFDNPIKIEMKEYPSLKK
ncbi:hypothetical protein, partial [Neisseria sicca]|uniref:hypothetical protein n=1 Tax=Neisseria sicca TaxID=490 RepID=UPI000565AB84